MIELIEKLETIKEILTNKRMQQDLKAFKSSTSLFMSLAWDLLKELNLVKELKKGISINELMQEHGIKNKKMIECILDNLVGRGFLKFENEKYYFLKEPKLVDSDIAYLKKYYPKSIKWIYFIKDYAKECLKEGKTAFETGFHDKRYLHLWEGIMEESPYSFRLFAIKKMISRVPKNAIVLDFGCGGGIGLEKILLQAKKKIKLVGFEPSKKYSEIAKEKIKKLENNSNELISNNAKNTFLTNSIQEIETMKFDAIFMSLVLNHLTIKETNELFKKLKSLLKEKGVLGIYQIINQSKFKRSPIWVMHIVPSHKEYPFKETYFKQLKSNFKKTSAYLKGNVVIASN